MSRTKKSFEEQQDEQSNLDYAQQRYEQEMYEAQEQITDELPQSNIWKAIAQFQSEVPILIQNSSTNKYTYVDLAEIVRIITPILRKYDLAYIQPLVGNNEIETILFHVPSGQQIKSRVAIPIVQLDFMNTYQSIGSAISYYRRYSISSMLNLISEKDTDANHSKTEITTRAAVYSKIPISNTNLETAIAKIQAGEYSIDELKAKYSFTDLQRETIKNI